MIVLTAIVARAACPPARCQPCVSAFGGDQFAPGQSRNLESFFFMFYFAINLGSFLSQLITPILRGDVSWCDALRRRTRRPRRARLTAAAA